MSFEQVDLAQARRFIGPASDTKPITGIRIGDEVWEFDTDETYVWTGSAWVNRRRTPGAFRSSSNNAELTMDGLAQVVTLAAGVKLGAGTVRIANQGLTTEAIRFQWGTSAANAEAGLGLTGGPPTTHATTGIWVGAAPDGFVADGYWGVPALATHLAIANAVSGDTQGVNVNQGVD